jgi:hypothetical protein
VEPLVHAGQYSFKLNIAGIGLRLEEMSHLLTIQGPFVRCENTNVPKHHLFAAIRMQNSQGSSVLKVYLVQLLEKEEYVPRSLLWLAFLACWWAWETPTNLSYTQVPIGVAFNRCSGGSTCDLGSRRTFLGEWLVVALIHGS